MDEPFPEEADAELTPARWWSRQLKDTFGDSLKKVNRLYNRAFGHASRKVIAHAPHMIDRDIMSDLVEMFPHEWKETSSHRLRSGQDMQYAFAYVVVMYQPRGDIWIVSTCYISH